MNTLTQLTYKELDCLISKLHMILSCTTDHHRNINVEYDGILFSDKSWSSDYSYSMMFEGNLIRFDNQPAKYNVFFYDFEHICLHFNDILETFVIDDRKISHVFDYDAVVNERNTLAISTVIEIPDDFEKFLDLYGKYGDMFISLDNIPFIEHKYDSIMKLLDVVLRGKEWKQ